jgi:hypothetical protein
VVVSFGFPAWRFANHPGGGPGNSPLPNTLSTGRKFKRQSANIHAVNRPLRRTARPMAAIVPAYFMENRAW